MKELFYVLGLFLVLFEVLTLANFRSVVTLADRLRKDESSPTTPLQSLYIKLSLCGLVWWIAALATPYWTVSLLLIAASILLPSTAKMRYGVRFALSLCELLALLYIVIDHFHSVTP